MAQGRAGARQGPLSLTPVEMFQSQPGMRVLTTAPTHAGTPTQAASSSPYPALDLRRIKVFLFPGFLHMQHSVGNAVSISTWHWCGLRRSSEGQVTQTWEAGCDPESGHPLPSPQERVVMFETTQRAGSSPELHKQCTKCGWYPSKFPLLLGIPTQKIQGVPQQLHTPPTSPVEPLLTAGGEKMGRTARRWKSGPGHENEGYSPSFTSF